MKISVVIPCRNEKAYIHECIAAIYANALPQGAVMRVFVVDGMSTDGTRELVQQLTANYPGLELVDNIQQLTPFAFNLGIHRQAADFVQIVGARHILSPDYIGRALEILASDPKIWCVGGQLINEYVNDSGRIISLAMDTAFGMGIGNFRILAKSGFTDTVTSPMYPWSVFEKIGFFDEQLVRNQDDDFNFRVIQAGGKIWFEHAISLKYYVRAHFNGLYKQFFQYGYWKVFVNRKHRAVTTFRQLIPPLFVLFLILSPIAFLLPAPFSIATLAVYALYVLMGIYFSVKKAGKAAEMPKIFMTFPILHISYGLGYLLGIVSFLIFRKQPSEKQKTLSR